MSKRGLPTGVQMRHDFHYVEELSRSNRPIGKVIPIEKIEPNPEQPRVEFGDLTELTASIKEKGVLEPLLVKPTGSGKWMIIAGERRWRASNLAGLEELPCIELDIDDNAIAEVALIENLQRKDLTIWEEADGLAALRDKFGYKHDDIARKISKSRTTVTELMTVAGLPADIRAKCRAANISSKSTLLEIARQFDEESMHRLTDKIVTEGMKNGEIRSAAKAERKPPVKNAAATKSFYSHKDVDGNFSVRVEFSSPDDLSQRNVLKALKDAFEALKSGEASV